MSKPTKTPFTKKQFTDAMILAGWELTNPRVSLTFGWVHTETGQKFDGYNVTVKVGNKRVELWQVLAEECKTPVLQPQPVTMPPF